MPDPDASQAVLSLQEGRYFSGIWMIEGDGSDWLGGLWKDLPDGDWNITYRFRYDNPLVDDPTGTADPKSVWRFRYSAAIREEEMLRTMKRIVDLTQEGLKGTMHILVLRTSDIDEIWKQVLTLPGVHERCKPKTK